jgi:hypothetical protein
MQHFKHPACTAVLNPAPGTEHEVSPLHIKRALDTDRNHTVTSYWRPNAEELEMLNAGHSIELTVWGVTHPPVYVGVTE